MHVGERRQGPQSQEPGTEPRHTHKRTHRLPFWSASVARSVELGHRPRLLPISVRAANGCCDRTGLRRRRCSAAKAAWAQPTAPYRVPVLCARLHRSRPSSLAASTHQCALGRPKEGLLQQRPSPPPRYDPRCAVASLLSCSSVSFTLPSLPLAPPPLPWEVRTSLKAVCVWPCRRRHRPQLHPDQASQCP